MSNKCRSSDNSSTEKTLRKSLKPRSSNHNQKLINKFSRTNNKQKWKYFLNRMWWNRLAVTCPLIQRSCLTALTTVSSKVRGNSTQCFGLVRNWTQSNQQRTHKSRDSLKPVWERVAPRQWEPLYRCLNLICMVSKTNLIDRETFRSKTVDRWEASWALKSEPMTIRRRAEMDWRW